MRIVIVIAFIVLNVVFIISYGIIFYQTCNAKRRIRAMPFIGVVRKNTQIICKSIGCNKCEGNTQCPKIMRAIECGLATRLILNHEDKL